MSQPGGNDFLIDLFREEVQTHSQILAEGWWLWSRAAPIRNSSQR